MISTFSRSVSRYNLFLFLFKTSIENCDLVSKAAAVAAVPITID